MTEKLRRKIATRGAAAACLLSLAVPLAAQAPASESGVVSYTPDFFSQARPQNALEMVQRVPGFSISAQSLVRGYAGAAGNVLIDGKQPVSKSEALTEILTRIPAGNVERIDLIRGGAPGIDMAGRSVVVNVIRRQAAGTRHTLAANSWVFWDGRVLPGLRYDFSRQMRGDRSLDITLDSNPTYTDAWGTASRVRTDASGALLQDAILDIVGDGRATSFRGNYKQPLAGGTVLVSVNLGRESFGDDQEIRVLSGRDLFANDLTLTNRELGLDYSRPITSSLKGQFLLTQRNGTAISESTARYADGLETDYRRREKDGETILRSRFNLTLDDRLAFEAGLEGAYNFLSGRAEYAENGETIPLPSETALVEEYRGELFGQANWKPSPSLSAEAGGRVELSRIGLDEPGARARSFVYVKPRLTLAWTPWANAQLRLRLEREVGQLAFGDFIASVQLADDLLTAGNVNLRPQREWIFEAAAEQRFWEKGAVTLTLRRRKLDDVIDFLPINDEFEAVGNIGRGTGLVAIASATAPLDRLGLRGVTLRANGTWRRSAVTDPITGERRRVSGERPFEGSAGFTHDVERLKLTYGFDANAGWREEYWRLAEISRPSLTHWYRLFAEYKPSPAWSVRAEFVNLDEYRRRRILFTGLRQQSPVRLLEDRVIPPPPRFNLRVRKIF